MLLKSRRLQPAGGLPYSSHESETNSCMGCIQSNTDRSRSLTETSYHNPRRWNSCLNFCRNQRMNIIPRLKAAFFIFHGATCDSPCIEPCRHHRTSVNRHRARRGCREDKFYMRHVHSSSKTLPTFPRITEAVQHDECGSVPSSSGNNDRLHWLK